MGRPRRGIYPTEGTQKVYERIKTRKRMTPRVANALRLYTSGVARTKKEAAEIVGLSPIALYTYTMPSMGPTIQSEYAEGMSREIHEKAVDVGVLLEKLSVEAVHTINHIRTSGSTEAVRLKAAIDLADRGPRTGKIQKHQVESFTLNGKDVERLSAAMLESSVSPELKSEILGNFEQVNLDKLPADG